MEQVQEVAACERYVADCPDNCSQFSCNELATRTRDCGLEIYLCIGLDQALIERQQWGYFEVGMYTEGPAKRRDVLKDFTMGRLDISRSHTFPGF